MAVAPDNSVLFVANANAELRYDSGSIGVIDLATVGKVIRQAPRRAEDPDFDDGAQAIIDSDACQPDPDHRETLVCEEASFLRTEAGVRIGNFATDIALQDFGEKLRVIVPTRGDPSVAWADYRKADGTLSCSTDPEGFALCDDAHRLSTIESDPDLPPIVEEPFGVFADAGPAGTDGTYAHGFAVVTHLTSGAVTLIDSPGNGDAHIADTELGVFAADVNGFRGATGVAGRTPGVDGDIIYVGSRSEDRIQTFTVGRPVNNAPPYLLPSDFFFLDAVGSNTGGSTDTRGMQFSPAVDPLTKVPLGDRLYVVNRRPPSLQIFDTSLDESGFPRNVASGASDICRQASTVTVFDADPDADPDPDPDPDDREGERAYVTCFQDGQVYVVDPRGQSQVEDIITVGRGPYAVVGATLPAIPEPLSLLFVSNFLEDTIAVIDVTPTSPNRNRVVLRIGTPRAP